MRRLALTLTAIALIATACGGTTDAESGAAADAVDATTTVATIDAPTTTTTAAPTTTTSAPTTTTAAPTTATTTSAPSGIVPGEDADVDAVVLAFSVAFDAESPYEEKAKYIDDPSGLEQTVASYLETGASFGGISIEASEVTIDGDMAEVTYDLLFGGNPTYPDLSGTAVLTDEGWKVPRSVFCSLMSAARVGCP